MSAYVEVRRAGYGGCPSMTACCGRQISRAPILAHIRSQFFDDYVHNQGDIVGDVRSAELFTEKGRTKFGVRRTRPCPTLRFSKSQI
jgi:hypothetical protein